MSHVETELRGESAIVGRQEDFVWGVPGGRSAQVQPSGKSEWVGDLLTSYLARGDLATW